MKILIFGATGMLGDELQKFISGLNDNFVIFSPDRRMVDLNDVANIETYIRSLKYTCGIDCIVNCSAITDTSGIQKNPDICDESFRVNALVPKHLAEICEYLRIKLIHISTDYVFSENSKNGEEFPINIYGYHKLIGELYIQSKMLSRNYLIIRTGWLYGINGCKSFVHKILKSIAYSHLNGKNTISVVNDQISAPTSTEFLSSQIINMIKNGANGIVSVAPSGNASRYEWSKKILVWIQKQSRFGKWVDDFDINQIQTNDSNMRYPKNSLMAQLDRKHFICNQYTETWDMVLLSYLTSNYDHFIEYFKLCLEPK